MTTEQRKLASRTIQELYLYPYRSKGENIVRCGAWMVSWIVGIVLQPVLDPRALGGAYLIFAVSLLLEFVPENKTRWIPRVIHGLFCLLLFGMLIGATVLIFVDAPAEGVEPHWLYFFSVKALPRVGWVVFGAMAGSIALTFLEAHKWFYDEKTERERETEAVQNLAREQFNDNLKGPSIGGAAQ